MATLQSGLVLNAVGILITSSSSSSLHSNKREDRLDLISEKFHFRPLLHAAITDTLQPSQVLKAAFWSLKPDSTRTAAAGVEFRAFRSATHRPSVVHSVQISYSCLPQPSLIHPPAFPSVYRPTHLPFDAWCTRLNSKCRSFLGRCCRIADLETDPAKMAAVMNAASSSALRSGSWHADLAQAKSTEIKLQP